QVGVLKGKIGYMSPEQVTGTAIDARSDIFSLGCVLYELLTQERTFKGETEFATFEKVRNAEYTSPKAYGVDLEPGLDKILRRVL
ncbi:protein kinase, partial [Burkholderia cenocepacia]|uniref:protein kinase domain-containing protein n=1 Tax=Burkholderia cenocepacia TaxID=95486 RepID=UPI000F979AA3